MLKYRAHIEDTESNLDISNTTQYEEPIVIEDNTSNLENDIKEYDDLSSAIDTGLEVNNVYINLIWKKYLYKIKHTQSPPFRLLFPPINRSLFL